MNNLSIFIQSSKANQFKVDYPYLGLFGTADVTPIEENNETVYECRLRNGKTMLVKKAKQLRKWIDVNLNLDTPLAGVIGMSIEDYLKLGH